MLLLDACAEHSFLIFPCTAFPRRDWAPPSFPRPDWFPGARRPAGTEYKIDHASFAIHEHKFTVLLNV